MIREYADMMRNGEINTDAVIFNPATDRDFWEGLSKDSVQPIIEEAEGYLNYEWPSLLATDFLAFERNGDRLAWETPWFKRRRVLATLVLAECIEYKGRFIDDIINGLVLICEETYWGLSAHRYGGTTGLQENSDPYLDIFASDTGLLVSLTVFFLKEVLEPTVVERVLYEVKFRMTDAFLKHDDFWWQAIPRVPGEKRFVNNWNPWVCENLIAVLSVAFTNKEYQHKVLAKVLEVLDIYIDSVPEDGGSEEGAGYWCAPTLNISLDLLFRLTSGQIDVYKNEKLQKFAKFGAAIYVTDKYIVNFGDCIHTKEDQVPHLLFLLGKRFNEPVLCSIAKNIYYKSCGGKYKFVYSDLESAVCALSLEKEMRDFDENNYPDSLFESSYYYESIELLTEWQNRKQTKGLFLSALGGNNGDSHAHNDVGSIIVYANGAPFLIDPGKGTYTKDHFNENRYKIWTNTSSWHNLPDINGEVQYHGKDFKAVNTKYSPNDKVSCFNTDLQNAYGKNSCLNTFNRHVKFDKENGKITVIDSFDFSKTNNNVTENLIFPSKPELVGNEIHIITENGTSGTVVWNGNGATLVDFMETKDDTTLSKTYPNGVYRVRITFNCDETSNFEYTLSCG